MIRMENNLENPEIILSTSRTETGFYFNRILILSAWGKG